MLIKNEIIKRVITGEITILFRRWKRASVKSGGTQMTQMGVLGINSVDVVTERQINERDARNAGFTSTKDLLASLPNTSLDIYRISVRFIGEDPRIMLRQNDDLSENELGDIITKLAKMDARKTSGPWTQKYLDLIRDRPNTRAADLAESIGAETAKFKSRVRKLKALGLTESLEVGYRLSPRGQKLLYTILLKI